MIRFHDLRLLALALASLALLCVAEPLRAAGTTTQQFEGYIIVPLPDDAFYGNFPSNTDLMFPFEGWVKPLGDVIGSIIINVNTERTSHTCSLILVDRNTKKNQVFLRYTVTRNLPLQKQFQDSTFVIVGGAGKFAGATGGGTVSHHLIFDNVNGTIFIPVKFFNAAISYPR